MFSVCRACVFSVLAVGIIACASSGPSSGEESTAVSSDKIVVSELERSTSGMSAYELINVHNSSWLRPRGVVSINNPPEVKVYIDGSGSPQRLSALKNIRGQNVATIEHFDGSEAQYKFGLGNAAGAILVRTKQ